MSKQIEAYEIIDHGVEHEQYFAGCGTSFTQYDACYTGAANSPREALNDALEQLACSGDYDIEPKEQELRADIDAMSDASDVPHNGHDHYHYVSILVR